MGDINLPSGYGGLLRYNEEYPSKIILKPAHVIIFVIAVMAFSIALRLLFPIAAKVATVATSG